MDEEAGRVKTTLPGYGTVPSPSNSSFNPTTLLTENGNSFGEEEGRVLLVQDQSIIESRQMGETPDQVLNSYGPFNLYILINFFLMSLVWALVAMPMMVSAFLLGDVCANTTNCIVTPGTISEEFNLTGSRAKFSDFTTMAFLLGNAIGANPISRFSDIKGRRVGMIVSLTFFGIFGLLSTISTNVYMFMIIRLFQGVLFPGCGIINWVHAYESSPMSLRKYAALVFGLMWVVGYCLLAPVAYLLPNWRKLMVAASLPSLIYAVILYFVLPESFHFMVTRGRKTELDKWLKSANKLSKNPRLDLTASIIINAHRKTQKEGTEDKVTRGVFAELLNNRVLLVYTLVLGYLWTCDSFVYYGISLISTLLSGAGSKYWSYALTGLVEIPSYLLSPFLLDFLGRKMFVSLSHFLTAAAFFGIMFVEDPRISLILWLIGKFGISCAFTSLFVYASEIFPTVLRSSCIGICVVLARIGGIFAPLTRLMTTINPNLPNIFFIASAVVGGVVTLVLPETRNRELPDDVSEIEVTA